LQKKLGTNILKNDEQYSTMSVAHRDTRIFVCSARRKSMPRAAKGGEKQLTGYTAIPRQSYEKLQKLAEKNYRTMSKQILIFVEQGIQREEEAAQSQGLALAQ
jgi:hypothetical protein